MLTYDELTRKIGNGEIVEINGKKYREVRGVIFKDSVIKSDEDFGKRFPQADPFIASRRSEYILHAQWESLCSTAKELRGEESSRRAIMYCPDWYWENHPNCVVAIQFMIRNGKIETYVFMRSLEAKRGYPYDLYSVTDLLVTLNDLLYRDLEFGEIVFLVSNFHVEVE